MSSSTDITANDPENQRVSEQVISQAAQPGHREAVVLALSDERDIWLRRLLDAERDAYRAGHDQGHAAGYAAGYEQAVRDWKVTAGLLPGGPAYAELERRRYGPGGRERFADPRPGDFPGVAGLPVLSTLVDA